jgi:hypothetical protein
MVADADFEGLGHGVGGDVVMGGADAAGGENQVIAGSKGIQGGDNLGLDIGHNTDFLAVNAQRGQELGDGIGIAVLGAPGEDFVPDHQHRSGLVGVVWHACLSHTSRGLENHRISPKLEP